MQRKTGRSSSNGDVVADIGAGCIDAHRAHWVSGEGIYVANATALPVILAIGWVGLAACAPPQRSAPSASAPSATSPPTDVHTTVAENTATSAPTCVGLSICTAPPDADGNPPCYYSDGWRADATDGGIEVWSFRDPSSNMSGPDQVTAVVHMKDGTVASQLADVDPGQQVHRFGFPSIDQSAVHEVLLSSSRGQCFVIGP